MRKHKTIQVPSSYLELIRCDLCGFEAKNDNWDAYGYEFNRTKIEHEVGTAYPENTYGVRYRIDICPACFREKLVPWLKEQGATDVEYKDFDYS